MTMSVGRIAVWLVLAVMIGSAAPALAEEEAGTWGGVVRAGPGRDKARITSLAEGERVTLLERTRVVMDGYPWFRIRYRGNKAGFMWGGILCANEREQDGLFQICPGTELAAAPPAENYVRGPFRYACRDGSAASVTYLGAASRPGEAGRGFAVVNDAVLGRVELAQVRSASDATYSDGRNRLSAKGREATFSWREAGSGCTLQR